MVPDYVSPASIARLAREIADRIEALPDKMKELVASASVPSAQTMIETLGLGPLRIDSLSVFSFVKRHWTPSHAERLTRELENVYLRVETFQEELPARLAVALQSGTILRWENGGEFLVLAGLTAQELRQWAGDIERKGSSAAPQTVGTATPARDRPDEEGYVEDPSDLTAYVSASEIVYKRTPPDIRISLKKLPTILQDFAANRVRWTRPRDKSGQPIPNRRSVHLADWLQYIDDQKCRVANSGDDGWPAMSEAEAVERAAEVRHAKTHRK